MKENKSENDINQLLNPYDLRIPSKIKNFIFRKNEDLVSNEEKQDIKIKKTRSYKDIKETLYSQWLIVCSKYKKLCRIK